MSSQQSECPDRIKEIYNTVLHDYVFWGFKHDLKKALTEPTNQQEKLDSFLTKFLLTSLPAHALKTELARIDDERVSECMYTYFPFHFYMNFLYSVHIDVVQNHLEMLWEASCRLAQQQLQHSKILIAVV